ncbi:MAG: polymerase alpha subunit, partial [Paenibacillus sp.]|nr:polymerase alpha subunit [Paenibacillus sp.]
LAEEHLSVLQLLQGATGVAPYTIPMNDPHVLSLFYSPDALQVNAEQIRSTAATYGIPEMGTAFVRSMLEVARPTSFSDLLQISGLSHGVGAWEGNARELLRLGTCSLADCISLRDTIMLKLVEHGSDPSFAFRFADHIRKGKGVPDTWSDELSKYDLPIWFVDSCRKIGYLFPKAHAVSYVMLAIRTAFYKLYYPLEFYAAYYSVRGAYLDLECALNGHEAIWNRLDQMAQGQSPKRAALEVALELTARGIRFQTREGDKSVSISDSQRTLPVPLKLVHDS